MDAYNNFSYLPGRSEEELAMLRLKQQLKTTYEERFRKMVALIKVSQRLGRSVKQKANGY